MSSKVLKYLIFVQATAKYRQKSAPVSGGLSLTQQYNADYGHNILTRKDNPTIAVSIKL